MKAYIIAFVLVVFVAAVPVFANEGELQKAYSIYYKGDKEAAIEMVESYVQDTPDAGAYYFLGYAYYEMKQMDRANDYFSRAFQMKDFYSPMPEK
jgi:tetratricopeptide (TPR) repeat protein